MSFLIAVLLLVIAFLLFVLVWSNDDARDTLLELLDDARARPLATAGTLALVFIGLAALAFLS